MQTIPETGDTDVATVPNPPAPNSSTSVTIAIVAPFALQGLAMVGIIAIVLIRDGTSIDSVINALLAFIVTNGIAGGAVGVSHVLTSTRVQRDIVAKSPNIPETNGVSASSGIAK